MTKSQRIQTAREKEMIPEFTSTIKKLHDIILNEEYYTKCQEMHEKFIKDLIKNPQTEYNKIKNRLDDNNSFLELEAVVLILLKEIFEIDARENLYFEQQREKIETEFTENILSQNEDCDEDCDEQNYEQCDNLKKENTELKTILTTNLIKNINQYNALYHQCIIKVSHIFFKSRYFLTYRPTIETIADMLGFIDTMCRSNQCKGS
jgi:hypothetical protein